MLRDKIVKIVSLLKGVANNTLDARAALKQWPDMGSETDNLLADSWHELTQFAADKDLHAGDPDYTAYQKDLLLDRAKTIREKYQLPE